MISINVSNQVHVQVTQPVLLQQTIVLKMVCRSNFSVTKFTFYL